MYIWYFLFGRNYTNGILRNIYFKIHKLNFVHYMDMSTAAIEICPPRRCSFGPVAAEGTTSLHFQPPHLI